MGWGGDAGGLSQGPNAWVPWGWWGPGGLTRHSSSRAGREMMMRSFFTSWVMKATSSDSERS